MFEITGLNNHELHALADRWLDGKPIWPTEAAVFRLAGWDAVEKLWERTR